MSTMNVAVVGLGWWGKQIVKSLSHSKDRFKIIAVADPKPPADAGDLAKQHGFRLESDFDALLKDNSIAGVILTSPNAFHLPQTLAAFAAGKAVFCEKPLTMTGEGARRMVEAAAKAGKTLGIGHELRYIEPFEALFKAIADGKLGRLLSMEANLSHDVFKNLPSDNWRKNPAPEFSPAGLYTGTGIHMTDMFCMLAGTPVEVRAETDTLVYDKPTEDYVRAKVLFKSGIHGMYLGAVLHALLLPLHGLWRDRLGGGHGRAHDRLEQADAPDRLDRARRAQHAVLDAECGRKRSRPT